MHLETSLTQQSKEPRQRNFYVYFDEWTGDIDTISNRLRDGMKNPYLETADPVVKEIMLGIKNIKKYVVAELVDGYQLVERENYLRLKQAENHLSKIGTIKANLNAEINIVFYLVDYKMEVNLSPDLIYKLTGKVNNSQIKIQRDGEYDKIVLYLIEKNNPLNLIETIEIDPIELLENGYKLYDLANLRSTLPLGKVDILTRRIFKSYGLKIKQNYVTVDYGLAKSRKREHIKILPMDYDEFTTFTIDYTTDGWLIKSNFVDPNEYKIYTDVRLFLTTDNPNQLLDSIIIPHDKIGNEQIYLARTKVDPKACKILMGDEGKNINFKFEELEYVKSGKY
jgi:hypothetical protein